MAEEIIALNYNMLRDSIVQALAAGKERARQAVEREKVGTYWGVGELLRRHVLANGNHAGYGEQVIARLSKDVGIASHLDVERRT